MCAITDQPITGLLKDLKSRGLLESTILMWAGEFGRLPTTQNSGGRDHNRNAFSLWMAGGGFKEGLAYGETDEFGYKSTVIVWVSPTCTLLCCISSDSIISG